jgi:hypothetical protein
MAIQLRPKRRQLPMHPLRLLIVDHEDHGDVVEEMNVEWEQMEVDDHDEAVDKNERSQNLTKRLLVLDELLV